MSIDGGLDADVGVADHALGVRQRLTGPELPQVFMPVFSEQQGVAPGGVQQVPQLQCVSRSPPAPLQQRGARHGGQRHGQLPHDLG